MRFYPCIKTFLGYNKLRNQLGDNMLKPLPSASLLAELLTYDPNTGIFLWNARRPDHFTATKHKTSEWQCLWWNNRFAGTVAGTRDPNGYILIRINRVDYRAHRLAWVLAYGTDLELIDHINGVRDDNRIENLRSVNMDQNAKNASRRKDNLSGTTGVGYYPNKGTWRARINHNGKSILLGYFKTYEEAVAARKAAEKIYAYHENHGR